MSTRRDVLKGLGSAVAALPFLKSFPAAAQSTPSGALPKLVIFTSPNGFGVGPHGNDSWPYEGWRPAGFPDDANVRVGTSMALPAQLPEIFRPLERHRSRLLFLEGLRQVEARPLHCSPTHVYDPHGAAPALLSGVNPIYENVNAECNNGYFDVFGGGISVDQLLGQKLGFDPLVLSFPYDGVHPNESFLSFRGPRQVVTPIYSPLAAFDRVFTGAVTNTNARRSAVLDFLARDFGSLVKKAPAADRARLEAHREAVTRLGTNLSKNVCGQAGLTRPDSYAFDDGSKIPQLMRDYTDVLVEALRCGWTRAGLVQTGNTGGNYEVSWVTEYGLPGGGVWDHSLAHGLAGDATLWEDRFTRREAIEAGVKLQAAYNDLFAYLLDKLAATQDVDGTPLLNNTLVMHVKPAGENHDWERLLWVLAGGEGLGVKTGRFEVVGLRSQAPHTYYNDLWLSVCHLMGATDLETFGEARFNRAPVQLT